MENIQQAVLSAVQAKPLDFKTHIAAELESKVASAIELRKQELAKTILNPEELKPEETTDEEL